MAYRNKNKYKSYANKHRHSPRLEPGLTGFLCTCNGKFREKDCLRESYNVLNEYADELFGPQVQDETKENPSDGSEEANMEFDIEASLNKEVASIKSQERKRHDLKRFQSIDSGANGVLFIKSTVPDPVKLAHTIVTNYSKGVQKSKFLLRLLPVEVTCKAYLSDISEAVKPLLEKYFTGDGKTFAIVYNHRNNDSLKRDDVIEKLANLVCEKNSQHKADLKQPQLVVLLEVIRSICCISVVPEYYSLKKYNLLENALKGGDSADASSTSKAADTSAEADEAVGAAGEAASPEASEKAAGNE